VEIITANPPVIPLFKPDTFSPWLGEAEAII
jgi:hypothetical protein